MFTVWRQGDGGGRSGTVGGMSRGCFIWVLLKRVIPKPDQHRKRYYTMRVVRHLYVMRTEEQQLHKISHWTDK